MSNLLKVILLTAAAACLSVPVMAEDEQAPQEETDTVNVTLHTSLGDITLELYPGKAPAAVENFVTYVHDGFYDGTIFHRVIDGFMIQGGGYTQDLQRKETRDPIKNESDNGLSNTTGTISMARLPQPDTATAQFFINVADNQRLDYRRTDNSEQWGYAVFGRVVDGMDVIDEIKALNTGAMGPFRSDVPMTTVVIESAEVADNMSAAE